MYTPLMLKSGWGVLGIAMAGLVVTSAPMQQKAEPAFKMVGLQVRTSNSRESTSEGLIGKQWQRLFGAGLIAQIPN
jgi:hypothetical protein